MTTGTIIERVPATKPLRDVRGFWRVLLAVVLPIPWLAKACSMPSRRTAARTRWS